MNSKTAYHGIIAVITICNHFIPDLSQNLAEVICTSPQVTLLCTRIISS